MIFAKDIKRLVCNFEPVYLNKQWCKWSWPAKKRFFLFFNLIKLIDRNSYTNIEIENASKIGWTNFSCERNIKIKAIIKPNNKLPLSPKNNFGSLNKEKLKHKKINIGIKIVNRKNLISSLGDK